MSSKIEQVTITDLPYELHIHIFRRLDQTSLNNAVLTCKWWKRLIESSCLWSLDFDDNAMKCSKGYIDFMLTTNRRFHTIRFYFNVSYETSIEIFRRHGSKVVRLFLFNYILEKFEHFTEIMKCFPNLEHLMIFEVMKQLWYSQFSDIIVPTGDIDVPPSNIDAPEMIKLKRLDVVQSPLGLLKYFSKSKLKIIKIFSSAYDPDTIPKPLTDFLKSQHHLTTISLRSINHEDRLFRTDKLNEVVPFQLRKLSLREFDLGASLEQYNNFVDFMKIHARTIQELELGGKFPDSIFKLVFKELKSLQSLEINIDEIPEETKFYENPSIKNLTLACNKSIGHRQSLLSELIKHVPNVTNLTLGGYFDRAAVLLIANNMKNITRLDVGTFTGRNFEGVQFQQLTSLIISHLNCHVSFDWNQFTKGNSRITELIIANICWQKKLNHDDIEQVSKNLKLQTLTIGFGFSVDQHFFDIIRKNCPDLKRFNLEKSCLVNNLSGLADVPGLRIYDTERQLRDDELYSNYTDTVWDDNDDDYAEIDYEDDEGDYAEIDDDVDYENDFEVDEDNMEVDKGDLEVDADNMVHADD